MKLESKIKGFKGHVVVPDFLSLPQVRAFEDARFGKLMDDNKPEMMSMSRERMLPFVLDFVQEWHLENVEATEEKLKEIPYRVVNWLADEVYALWKTEVEVPNE